MWMIECVTFNTYHIIRNGPNGCVLTRLIYIRSKSEVYCNL